jgi:antitoxin VapB
MGMQLNIKSDEAYALATRLAELTGENRTTAVTDLLREKVTELERKQDAQERACPFDRRLFGGGFRRAG